MNWVNLNSHTNFDLNVIKSSNKNVISLIFERDKKYIYNLSTHQKKKKKPKFTYLEKCINQILNMY